MSLEIKSECLLDTMKNNNNSIRNQRMEQLYSSLKFGNTSLVESFEAEVAKITQEIKKHEDLSARSTVSLEVSDIDADDWNAREQELYEDLREAMIRLDIAKKIQKAKFSAEANNGEQIMTFEN